jgi:hypothetical protein
MNTDPDNFDELKVLLAWKRNEVPPPGYFATFSDRVMAQLQAPMQDLPGRLSVPWWDKWLDWFDARPVLVGVYGVAVCSLLVTGITLRQAHEDTVKSSLPDPTAFAFVGPFDKLVASNRFVRPSVSFEAISSTVPLMSYGQDRFGSRNYDWQIVPASINYQ